MHANEIHLIKTGGKNQPWLRFLFIRSGPAWSVKISSCLFVCLFRGSVFRAPCMNFISCQSSVTSYQKSVKCQRLSHYIVLFIFDALPHRTSTGDGFAAGLIWIIRRRRMRYLCSRGVEISSCDIAGDGHRQTAVCTFMHYVDRHIYAWDRYMNRHRVKRSDFCQRSEICMCLGTWIGSAINTMWACPVKPQSWKSVL